MRRTCFEQTECNTMQEDMINLYHTAGWNCLSSPVFLGCSAPPYRHPLWFCKVTFCWCYIDAMYRCFSGFAACVGDAAGTWGSIVLSVCVCVNVYYVVTSVCLLSVLVYIIFFFCLCFGFLACGQACHVLCLHFCVVLDVCRDCSVYLWFVSVFYNPVYVCQTVCVWCVHRGSVPGFGQSRGDSCADGLQREGHGLPAQCLPGSTPPHPVRCK